MITTIVCLAASCTTLLPSQPKATRIPKSAVLKFNLRAGQTFPFKITASTIQGSGSEVSGGLIYTISTDLKVKRADSREMALTITYTDVKATDAPGTNSGTSVKNMVKRMQGFSYGGTYDHFGNLLKPFESGRSFSGSIAGGMYGGKIGILGIQYPKTSVTKGSRWTGQFDLAAVIAKTIRSLGKIKPGTKTIPVKYELKGFRQAGSKVVADIGVVIAGSTTLTVTASNGSVTESKSEFNIKGQMTVDYATGLPIKYELAGTTSAVSEISQIQNVRLNVIAR